MLPFQFLRWTAVFFAVASATFASADCVHPYWSLMTEVEIGYWPDSIVAADLNGDERPDLVVSGRGAVSVILTTGPGTFAAPTQVHAVWTEKSLLVAELTGGGGLDIAVADGTTARLVVIPGNGDGTFAAPVFTTTPVIAQNLATGDFDEDGKNDLLFVTGTTGRIYRGTGSGNFAAWTTFTIPAAAGAVATGDFDADGNLDIAVGEGSTTRLDLFFGDGTGAFTSTFSQPAFYQPTRLRTADVDQDGKLDLLGQSSYGSVSVMRNLSGRTFGDPLYANANTSGFAVGDLNGDPYPDVLSPERDLELFTYTGTAAGTLRLGGWWYFQNSGSYLDDAAIADFDDDGRNDAAVVSTGHNSPSQFVGIVRNECGTIHVHLTTPSPVVSTGQSVALKVSLAPPPGLMSHRTPTGTVTLREGETVLGTRTMSGDSATFELTLPAGTHTLTASYDGDAQHEPAVSEPLQQRVIAGTSTTSLSFNTSTLEYGQVLAITATVTSTVPGTPGGTVKLQVDGVDLQSWHTINAPSGTVHYAVGSLGTHSVTARYDGDAEHPPSSATKTLSMQKATPRITFDPPSSGSGDTVTPRVRVANPYRPEEYDVARPTGTVTLTIDSTTVGTRTLDGSYWLTFDPMTLTTGRHLIRIDYSGDDKYNATTTYLQHNTFPAGTTTIDARGDASGIRVTWYGPMLIVRRRTGLGPVDYGTCCPGSPWDDEGALPNTVYVYFMESHGGGVSGADVAQRISFTDDPLVKGTRIRAVHVAEIVTGMNRLRMAANLAPVTLSNATAPHVVTAAQINTLRAAINEARAALGAVPFTFTGTVAPGGVIQALHVQELREAIR